MDIIEMKIINNENRLEIECIQNVLFLETLYY